jgi:hypothetical protein
LLSLFSFICCSDPHFFFLTIQRYLLIKGILVVGVGLLATDLLFAKYIESKRWNKIRKAFEKGSFPPLEEPSTLLPRDDVQETLRRLLQPSRKNNFYYLITGEHGTGKTTMVLLACSEIKQGLIYVNVPDNVPRFVLELAKAIGEDLDDTTLWGVLKHKLLKIEKYTEGM